VDGAIDMGLLSAPVPVVQEFVVRVGEREHTVRVDGQTAQVDGVAHTVQPSSGGRTSSSPPTPSAASASPSTAGLADRRERAWHRGRHAVEVRTAQAAALAAAMSGGRAGGARRLADQGADARPGRQACSSAREQTVERGQPSPSSRP
jgi:hypothetical protein